MVRSPEKVILRLIFGVASLLVDRLIKLTGY